MEPTKHKLNMIIGGIIDSVIPADRCPTCKEELSNHDWNCDYQAYFCRTCYDWVPLKNVLHISCDLAKPCPKCDATMFCITEVWEKVLGRKWCRTPHRWGCGCGYEEPYQKEIKYVVRHSRGKSWAVDRFSQGEGFWSGWVKDWTRYFNTKAEAEAYKQKKEQGGA